MDFNDISIGNRYYRINHNLNIDIMKKHILIFTLLLVCSFSINAQTSTPYFNASTGVLENTTDSTFTSYILFCKGTVFEFGMVKTPNDLKAKALQMKPEAMLKECKVAKYALGKVAVIDSNHFDVIDSLNNTIASIEYDENKEYVLVNSTTVKELQEHSKLHITASFYQNPLRSRYFGAYKNNKKTGAWIYSTPDRKETVIKYKDGIEIKTP